EDPGEPIEHHFVIVCEQDPDQPRCLHDNSSCLIGTRTKIDVPTFGVDSISSRPPANVARSRMFTSPSEAPSSRLYVWLTSKPRPLSSITSTSSWSWRSKTTVTCVASECLTTLCSAS